MPSTHAQPRPEPTTAEFERQVDTLVQRGYPALAGLPPDDFRESLQPLAHRLAELVGAGSRTSLDRLGFVVVVPRRLADPGRAIELVSRRGQAAFSVMAADDLARFEPIDGVELPPGPAYLLTDVDRGDETRNVRPDAALDILVGEGRSPLTIEEGIALVTHHPEAVVRNRGFSLLGSRCGDRRVAALWISEGRPKLGWCWAGNPHTWLGSASCASRLAL